MFRPWPCLLGTESAGTFARAIFRRAAQDSRSGRYDPQDGAPDGVILAGIVDRNRTGPRSRCRFRKHGPQTILPATSIPAHRAAVRVVEQRALLLAHEKQGAVDFRSRVRP